MTIFANMINTPFAVPQPAYPQTRRVAAPAIKQLSRREAGLPALSILGGDLQQVSHSRRLRGAMLPIWTTGLFCAAYAIGLYPVLPLVLLLHFIVAATFTHDVVHGTAGISRRTSEWILFGLSLMLLESGHAFRIAHLHHHSHCLQDDDFEGAPARMTLVQALLAGPLYLPRHWWHAWQRTHSLPQRRWMLAEAVGVVSLMLLAIALLPCSAGPLTYALCMWIGSCLYPLTTAWLPHFKPDNTMLGQARTLRGKIIPALLGNLSYHLEHHLYPQVPAHNLPRLAARLDPYFVELGVPMPQVP